MQVQVRGQCILKIAGNVLVELERLSHVGEKTAATFHGAIHL